MTSRVGPQLPLCLRQGLLFFSSSFKFEGFAFILDGSKIKTVDRYKYFHLHSSSSIVNNFCTFGVCHFFLLLLLRQSIARDGLLPQPLERAGIKGVNQ